MCPFRLYRRDPHCGQASLGVSIRSPASPFLTFAHSPDYDKVSKSSTRRALLDFSPRLGHMEEVLSDRTWLTGAFSVGYILMVDVLRLVDRFDGLAEYPACWAYVKRATARPAFKKAHADQMKHFDATD